ncbi:MAG: RNA-binding S4 domain-containing protein [Myxococcota bacterium]|nr:RNA-binding S4 domain-containing protein [Myxococcota bacterium]
MDKWLWATRCFKTRTLASSACDAGHVRINGAPAKASKSVRVGDTVEALTPGGPRILEVAALGDKRVSIEQAKLLYIDHTPPPEEREEPPVARERGLGRPTKRDRRRLDRILDEGW